MRDIVTTALSGALGVVILAAMFKPEVLALPWSTATAQEPEPEPDMRATFAAWQKLKSDPSLLTFEEWDLLRKASLLQ